MKEHNCAIYDRWLIRKLPRRKRLLWLKIIMIIEDLWPLQWRHNQAHGVSNHQRLHCVLNYWFRRRSKTTSKLRVTGLCVGNSPVTGECPAQKSSDAENVFIRWHHHDGVGYDPINIGVSSFLAGHAHFERKSLNPIRRTHFNRFFVRQTEDNLSCATDTQRPLEKGVILLTVIIQFGGM